jgi:hypothetical protein
MSTHLLPPKQWAQDEFGFAQLGDQRRTQRLVKIATNLAGTPAGTLPQAFADWAELKAAYRFFKPSGVYFEPIVQPHLERTQQACREPGEYLIIEDSTDLDYSPHSGVSGLGVIGDGAGRGFEIHTALAVRVEAWTLEQRPEGTVVGLFGQHCRRPKPAPKGESRRERLQRPRKSQWWAWVFKGAGGPPPGRQWIYIADAESDFYEPIATCQQHGVDFVIRACQKRRLEDGSKLPEVLAQAPVLGQMTVELRSRRGQPARTAIVQLRSVVKVDLDGPWRPGGWQAPLRDVWALEVREVDVPEGVAEPLHWILLTSLPCASWVQAQRVVGRYTARWWVEEYHKALKTGAGVEDSPLETADRLEALIAVLAVVAVRLLSTKFLARSRPDSTEVAESFGPEMLAILAKKLGQPKGGWSNRNVIVATARLGGFIGRKSDGMPGWQTIWRGWQRLMWMCEGAGLMGD